MEMDSVEQEEGLQVDSSSQQSSFYNIFTNRKGLTNLYISSKCKLIGSVYNMVHHSNHPILWIYNLILNSTNRFTSILAISYSGTWSQIRTSHFHKESRSLKFERNSTSWNRTFPQWFLFTFVVHLQKRLSTIRTITINNRHWLGLYVTNWSDVTSSRSFSSHHRKG